MSVRTKRAKKSRAPRPRKKTPEGLVASQITDFLTAHHIRYTRNNVGVARYGNHYVKYGENGAADYTAFVPAKEPRTFYILNIETKAPKATQRAHQELWQQLVESMGEFYILARSYEPVEAWLKERKVLK